MKSNLYFAVQCCEQNKVSALASIVPSQIPGNSLVEVYKFKSLSRTKVPLLCIAAVSQSLDCVKYLINNGADIEKPDAIHFFKFPKKNRRLIVFLLNYIPPKNIVVCFLMVFLLLFILIFKKINSRPVHWACMVGSDQVLSYILDKGAEPNPISVPFFRKF